MAGVDRRGRSLPRARARLVPGAEAGVVAPRPGRFGASAALFRLSQYDPARKAGRLSRRSRARGTHYLDHSLERARHGVARQPRLWRARRPRCELCVGRGNLRDRLQSLLSRGARGLRRRSGVFPAAFGDRRLRPRLSRGSPRGERPRALSTGGWRRRALVLPPSLADARLLAIPDRIHGARRDQRDLPGPVHALSREPRADGDGRSPGVGRVRRWRARRAGGDRGADARFARAPRQFDRYHQLQSPAARRTGARQRSDHPGAGGTVHWRRLECDQSALGLGMGRSVRPRQAACAPAPVRRDRRRRISEPRRARWRLQPGEVLRSGSRIRASSSRR